MVKNLIIYQKKARDRSRLRLRIRAPASSNRAPAFGFRALEPIAVLRCSLFRYVGVVMSQPLFN